MSPAISPIMRTLIFAAIFLLLPELAIADCTCDPEDSTGVNKNLALKYKIAAIASILAASAVGVLLPVASKVVPALSPDQNFFLVIKAFAAGVVLSTGFLHILPDAFESLTSPCISERPWADFPFSGFIAMVAVIGTLMVDTYATSYLRRQCRQKVAAEEGRIPAVGDVEEPGVEIHAHATHGHSHGPSDLDNGDSDLLRHCVISQVLELGIIVHSVIIGIALGASETPKTIKPLIAALTFHQFFEGIGFGECITQAKFHARAVAIMTVFFAATTPVGITIGIGIANSYSETSPQALILPGIFNSASAGILIYMALVDLLAADFMSPKMQKNTKLQLLPNLSLLVGAGCMSLLAKWA